MYVGSQPYGLRGLSSPPPDGLYARGLDLVVKDDSYNEQDHRRGQWDYHRYGAASVPVSGPCRQRRKQPTLHVKLSFF